VNRRLTNAYLLLSFEELGLALLRLGYRPLEVSIRILGTIDGGDVNLGRCGNDVGLVHSSQRNTVDLEWTCQN